MGSHQGSSTTITRDGHGRTKLVDAHWKVGPDGTSGDLVTSARYQATGEPTSITQTFPGGSVTRSMSYDSLGRMVQNVEPNAGTWTYAYDAEGRLVGTSDARGCGENIFYDPGGRILAADYSPCQPPPAQAEYTRPPANRSGARPGVVCLGDRLALLVVKAVLVARCAHVLQVHDLGGLAERGSQRVKDGSDRGASCAASSRREAALVCERREARGRFSRGQVRG